MLEVILIVTTLSVLGAEEGSPPRVEEQVLSTMAVCKKWKEDVLSLNNPDKPPHYEAECVYRFKVDI
jgi:hypothetical protein